MMQRDVSSGRNSHVRDVFSYAEEVADARRLVLLFGWNTTCFQIVNPGIERWFAPEGDAVVGFVRRGGVRVVAGAPVCPADRLAAVVEAFEAAEGGRVVYFGAEGRLRALFEGRRNRPRVSLGAQPIWSPESWVAAFEGDRRLRAQRNRARNKGLTISEWASDRAASDPELRRVLAEWLATRGLPPMRFLVESQTLDDVEGRRLFVACRGETPVGFVTLAPIPGRRGWLTEQFVRGPAAPNGTIEATLLEAIRTVAAEGAAYVTMGIVPLARQGETRLDDPPWLPFLKRWARAHGRRFYDFDGLAWFKQKFHPDAWEPVYVISHERRFSFRTLWASAGAFVDGPLMGAVLRALWGALRVELRRR